MPPADIRQLRDLMRYRFKLTCFQSSEKNRLQNCLTVSNIQLGNVVSDTFGKSAQAILDKLLENPADTSFDLEPLVYRSLKKKLPELRDAIDGYITPEQAGKLKVIKAHYESLESRKAELEELILALAAPYQQELAILQTAPGIRSDFTAIGIISEIGTNMEDFPSAKHLYSWAGLTPTNNEDDYDSSGSPVALTFEYGLVNDFLSEWCEMKTKLNNGEISPNEYFEWKIT